MKIVVFGATGATGQALCTQGKAAGHEVTALVRREMVLDAKVIAGDLFDPALLATVLAGQDAVLSALGTRPWRHTNICSEGTRAIAAGMQAAGVKRIVAMSSQGVGDSSLGPVAKLPAGLILGRSFRDKGVMEDELAATELDWIVVRPGLLTNGAARGTWRTATDDSLRGGKIARADVAAFMLQQLTADTWLRQRPVLVW